MSTLNPIFQNQKAQEVEVVNELNAKIDTSQDEPLIVKPPLSLLANNEQEIRVVDNGSHQNEIYVHPTSALKNLYINAVQVVNSGVGYFVPYSFVLYNVSDAAITAALAGVYTQLAEKYTSAEINIFYCTMNSSKACTFSLYNPL